MNDKKVTLLKPHNHADKSYLAGAEIVVDEPTAAWLAARGVIAPLDLSTKPSAPTKA